jgi:DNA mismatch repair protein MSH2
LKQVKGGIYFRTKKLKKTAERYAEATEAYQKLQTGLVKEIVNIACEPESFCIRLSPIYMPLL